MASRPRFVSHAREVRDRANEPEATPEPSAERAQNRHGGAPRGAVPVARDGPRFANVASRDYARDRIKDTASRRSAIPSVGDRKLRRKERQREPGHENVPGTKKRKLRISWDGLSVVRETHRTRSRKGRRWVSLSLTPSYEEKRERRQRTRAQQRAAGTKKTALFDIVNRK